MRKQVLVKKEIGQYDINNNLVATYFDVAEASEKTGIGIHTIKRGIKEYKIKQGFLFAYTGKIIDKREKLPSNSKNVRLDIETANVDLKYWELRICPVCERKFYARKKYEKITCCEECYDIYVENHKEEINAKRSKSCYESYHSKSKEEIAAEQAKARKTCIERYGVDKPQKTEEYREKMREIQKSKDWSERSRKAIESIIPKYQKICTDDDLELLEFRNRFDVTLKCNRCGNIFDCHVLGYLVPKANNDLCRHCHPNTNSTSRTYPTLFVEKILENNNIEFYKNDRSIIKPLELDIVIPSLRLAFEINGDYWHSEEGGGKDKKYHIDKTQKAYENGYKLIHIFEDEILEKPDIVTSRILNLIGKTPNKIYARKCIIKEIDHHTKKDFLNVSHIDGDSVSKWNIGLFYDDTLVCVGTFGRRKISGKDNLELIRFASKLNTTIVGGFSKILMYFIKNYNPEQLITYADIRWSGLNHENNVYIKNGFSFVKDTPPNYFYIHKNRYNKRLNRLNFTKQKLAKLGYNISKTEREIMRDNGYDRIWDCGSMKFEYKNRDA